MGGDLLRPAGGCFPLKDQRLKGPRIKGVDGVRGSGDFAEKVLDKANEEFEQSTLVRNEGLDLEALILLLAEYCGAKKGKLEFSDVPFVTLE